MAKSNHARVGEAIELLARGLAPFAEREARAVHGEQWLQALSARMDQKPGWKYSATDTQFLLKAMFDNWHEIFSRTLGQNERTLVKELQGHRNNWAHQEKFSTNDAYRAIDSVSRLLQAIAAPEAPEAERMLNEILRLKFEEQARHEHRKVMAEDLGSAEVAGLTPWRELIAPHPDVASGRYQTAEFAADLAQVHRGEAASEYLDPIEFFRRTFLTEGLGDLLERAVQRLTLQEKGGVPIVNLQTNFGGGKTHSLLALYHLSSGRKGAELPGVEEILQRAKVKELPFDVTRVVLVGTAISPVQPKKQKDGTTVHTLWGELAYQLGGKKAYATIKTADEKGVSPGSDVIVELLKKHGPCLILIDEWVAYARLLYGKDDLPGGTFDAHFTFAQALCEAVRAVPGALLVISIPASEPGRAGHDGDGITDIEVGGQGGREALKRLVNVIGRMESPWRPASAEESFEIVRRRLFEPMDSKNKAKRDAVARGFYDFYQKNISDFPSHCRETAYEKRIRDAYPIHPELFDRLYEDWSSLPRFQRTRGVLRLMAGVVHALWESESAAPLIMPAHIPIQRRDVSYELTRHLDDHWIPVIESDIDGPNALPLQLDRDNPNLGRYSACRRVARVIYMGSAPTLKTANQGIDDRSIRLGSVMPGESPAVFGDALRRLVDQATHLYSDGGRYWYSTQTNVTRSARDKAEHYRIEAVHDEIVRRLRGEKKRGDFAAVHIAPAETGDVPDVPEARLVVLGPEHCHSTKTKETPAVPRAREILEARGTIPRQYRNMLVFLAPDKNLLPDLESATRDFMAWDEIDRQKETLNLDAHQTRQVETKRRQAEDAVERRIRETWQFLLAPTQAPQGEPEWKALRVSGDEALAVRASTKLRSEEDLITTMAPSVLRIHLDRVPLWEGEAKSHVGLKRAWECFAQYLYLPRLRDVDVFLSAVQAGTTMITWERDGFAYADAYDAAKKRYVGLRIGSAGGGGSVAMNAESVIVKPEVAARQLADEAAAVGEEPPGLTSGGEVGAGSGPIGPGGDEPPPKPTIRRFSAHKTLDPQRVGRDAGEIATNILQYLTRQPGAEVEVTLEINVRFDGHVPDADVRTVTENCAVLKLKGGFEEE